jgi:branched-chain amino acid transport system ATP-binding protein
MSLVVHGLTKRYGGVVALNNVDLVAAPSEITAVIGPNGAGKTTLLNLISGVVPADSGRTELAGLDITRRLPHDLALQGLTRTYQSPQLFEDMSVLETVMVGAHTRGSIGFMSSMILTRRVRQEEREMEKIARLALDRVRLPQTQFSRATSELAYGLQRRLEIARALAMSPKAILFDEPAAGLNDKETREISELIGELAQEGLIIVLVEHDMEMVMGISHKIVVMNFGEKIAEGSPAEVQANPDVVTAYLGSSLEEVGNA